MTARADNIADQLIAYLRDDVEVGVFGDADERIACLTPIEYPDGDNVVVWAVPHDSDFEITDFGESLTVPVELRPQDRAAFLEAIAELARVQGVSFANNRLVARCGADAVGEYVWRTALAAASVARLTASTAALRSSRSPRESGFADELEQALRSKRIEVDRQRRVKGVSGHEYRATFFVPASETVIEPVGGHWNQVTAAYAEFGDLKNANGYRLFAVLDDREAGVDEGAASLLAQVGSVVQWSRRVAWLDQLA